MANICEVDMKICGKKENVEAFLNALEQKSDIWIGRGVSIQAGRNNFDEYDDSIQILGSCKWSLESALVKNAYEMKKGSSFVDVTAKEILTIEEACKRFHVVCEAFTEEPGCCFAEHFIYENGTGEWNVCEYKEEYDEENDKYITTGGFQHDFQINAPEEEEIEL